MNDRILSFLGLAQKSGNLASGEDTCEKLIKNHKASLVIIPKDASENTIKKFTDMTSYRNIKCLVIGTRDELSNSIGKNNRTVYVIKNQHFAEKIYDIIKESEYFPNKSGGE